MNFVKLHLESFIQYIIINSLKKHLKLLLFFFCLLILKVVSHDYHQYSSQTTTTPTTATSRVFVKTSDKLVDENLRSPTMPNAHFQGVSDWSERTTMQQQRNSTHTTNNHQQHHLSSHHQSRAISPVNRIQVIKINSQVNIIIIIDFNY